MPPGEAKMVRITIDQKLADKLLATDETVELCDASGRLIGKVTPAPQEFADPWARFQDLTDEEIERRANAPGPRYSSEQVKEFLKNPESRPW